MMRIDLPPNKVYRVPFVAPRKGETVVEFWSDIPVSAHVLDEAAAQEYASGPNKKIASLASLPPGTHRVRTLRPEPDSTFYLLIVSESETETAKVRFRVTRHWTSPWKSATWKPWEQEDEERGE